MSLCTSSVSQSSETELLHVEEQVRLLRYKGLDRNEVLSKCITIVDKEFGGGSSKKAATQRDHL